MASIRETAENFNIGANFSGTIRRSEQMADHTTFKIGGPAALYLEPADVPSLVFAVARLRESGIPYFILGGGSNIVVADSGIDGAVISLAGIAGVRCVSPADVRKGVAGAPCSQETAGAGQTVEVFCGAGAPVASLVNFCTEHALSGAEQFAGLPGTVGGALYMNARCFDRSISDILTGAEYVAPENGEIARYTFKEADWAYKVSPFQHTHRIITGGIFRFTSVECTQKDAIAARCAGYIAERVSKGHFRFPSAGSVFRNNHAFGKPSGKIIDEAGLRGYRIGGAQIAPWHGNFIINVDHATAHDVRALVLYIQRQVKEKTGFELEPEIICIPDSSD